MVRKKTEISGLRDIKTLQSTRKRSIPRIQSSAYLDLYVLRKERDRLEKEIYILDKRKKNIEKRLKEIDAQMDNLEKAEVAKRQTDSQGYKGPLKRDLRRMALKY